MPKYLLLFEKAESVRWLGHLDLLRAFERAIRRAGLPIAFSNGFNPRERLVFASALSTGITGKAEPVTLELTEPLEAEQILLRLNAALPSGIRIQHGEPLPEAGVRDLLNGYDRAEYEAVCACSPETTEEAAQSAIGALLARPRICLVRVKEGRTKEVDIRPFLVALALCPETLGNARLTLRMIVALGEAGNAKPVEVVAALSEHLPDLKVRRVQRVRLLQSRAGAIAPEPSTHR